VEAIQAEGGALQAGAVDDSEKGATLDAHCVIFANVAAVPAGQAGAVEEVEGGFAAETGVRVKAVSAALQGARQAAVYKGLEVETSNTGQADSLGVAGGAAGGICVAAVMGHA
jgi:hypothetical protein